jgi:cell division protein FtsN
VSTKRDYKPKGTWKANKNRARANGALVLVIVLVALFAGFLTYIRQQNPSETTTAATPPATPTAAPAGSVKPKYSFYQDLPRREVLILRGPERHPAKPPSPEVEQAPAAQEPAAAVSEPLPSPAPPAGQSGYLVQAGAYSRYTDADRMRARLALLGVKAHIELALINDTQVHRVRIGPLAGAEQAQAIRQKLSDNRIPSITVKVN